MENVYVLTSVSYSGPITRDSKPFITNEGVFSSLKKGKEWLKKEIDNFGEGGVLHQTGMFNFILVFDDDSTVHFEFKRWVIDQLFS